MGFLEIRNGVAVCNVNGRGINKFPKGRKIMLTVMKSNSPLVKKYNVNKCERIK